MAAPLQQPPAVRAAVRRIWTRAGGGAQRKLAPSYIGCTWSRIRLPAIVNAGPAELYIPLTAESNRVRILLEP